MELKKIIIIVIAFLLTATVAVTGTLTVIEIIKRSNKEENYSSEVSDMSVPSISEKNSQYFEENTTSANSDTANSAQTENNTRLTFIFPRESTVITTESSVNISGNSDPQKPLTVNGENVQRSADGSFLLTVQLSLGINTFKFEHKGKVYTITVERQDHNLGNLPPTEGDFQNAKTLEEYLSKGITTVTGSEKNKNTWMYKVNSTGIYVKEVDIDLGGKNEYTIAHLTDFHIVKMNDKDFLDPELAQSYEARKNAFPDAERNAKIAMKYASFFDKTIITGDAVDYLSVGALDALKEIIGNTKTLVTMGNHEYRKVWYGNYTDTADTQERYQLCQDNWHYNNIHYHSEIQKNKIMIITMNNGAGATYENYYSEKFTAKDALGNTKSGYMDEFLGYDLELAKKNGYAVLIFQHTPISTNNAEFSSTPSLINGIVDDFKGWYVGSDNLKQTETDKKVYKLITENAGLIKGIFCGHTHNNFYTEIKAKSTPNSADYDSVIPQHILSLNARLYGNAIKITVKY